MTLTAHINCQGVEFPETPLFTEKRRDILRCGLYEYAELKTLREVVRPSDRVLELGGGIGYISTQIARHIRPQDIVTIEADPELVEYMRAVHALNNARVTVIQAAVGPSAEKAKSFEVRADFVNSSLHPNAPGQVVRRPKVRVFDLPTLLEWHNPTILFCDIEGLEAELLSQTQLIGVRAVVVEFHLDITGPEAERDVIRNLQDQGFSFAPETSRGQVTAFIRDEA